MWDAAIAVAIYFQAHFIFSQNKKHQAAISKAFDFAIILDKPLN